MTLLTDLRAIRFVAPATLALLVACSGGQSSPCPPGQIHDGQSCVAQQGGCPYGQVFNGQSCVVQQTAQCPPGQVFNGQACVAQQSQYCPPGYVSNGRACVAQQAPPQCPPGHIFNGQSCIPQPQTCPPGQMHNGQTCVPQQPPANAGCTPAAPANPAFAAPLTQALGPLATQHAPAGAKPVGSAVAGQFQPNQCLTFDFQLQPGKCYTAVGFGLPGVSNVDLKIVLKTPQLPGVTPPPLAEDKSVGATSVLGGKPSCYRWSAPVAAPATLVVRVSGGQGMAAAQLYAQ